MAKQRKDKQLIDDSAQFEEMSVQALKKAGYRITQQRRAVISCIARTSEPLSAPRIYEELSKKSDTAGVDKVSVYRVLETLLELHLVHRVIPHGSYIACTHRHCTASYHVMTRCTACQSVEEKHVPHEVVAPLLFHLSNTLDFKPDGHLLHIDGVCSRCKA